MEEEVSASDQPLSPSLLAMRLSWDVFLSFRGEDTRHNFTGQLYSALDSRGVRTFIDNEGLRGGDEIAPSLVEAIHDSAASVAVISPRYADSRWCLEELARLFECRKLVIPVFYKVNPSHVRRQTGPFGDAFRALARDYGDHPVKRWKHALQMAGNRSGFVLGLDQSDESHVIQRIVTRVLSELSRIPVQVAAYPVGLGSRVDHVISLLNLQHNDVRFLGIHGQPGIGKTTLAKAVFSRLVAYFKRRCFIANFKETLDKEGVLSIQNRLIRDLSLQSTRLLDDEVAGKSALKSLIGNEDRVLVVLDDSVGVEQLDAVGIQRKWFSEGSRIIATSRDKDRLLSFVHEDELYEAKGLLDSEALELFSYHALRRKEPTEEFRSLSKEMVSLTGRLPLAIEVFGSVLLDKRTRKEWESALQKLRLIRPSRLQDVLRISYDELDDEQKCMFLDISCLFVQAGMKRVDAIDVFLGCGFNAEEAIGKLMKKSLLKINQDDDVLWMHDQIRDMGRQIVIEQDVQNLGNRSRLWNYDDVVHVLTNNKGTEKVRGIILDTGRQKPLMNRVVVKTSSLLDVLSNFISYGSEISDLNKVSFQPLLNLKLLQINEVNIRGEFNYMPPELRWLRWKGCPWKALPSALSQEIRVLDLSESSIECLWSSSWLFSSRNQVVKDLTVLKLSKCHRLTSLPDFSRHHKVTKLVLEDCVSLSKIHDSLGRMTSLVQLKLTRCTSLISLPRDVSGLKLLEELILSDCSALTQLPCDLSSLNSLRELHLDRTGVTELPSLFHLTRVELIMLDHCTQLKRLPSCIGNMGSLKILSLTGSAVEELPDSIGLLRSLEQLKLGHCSSLRNIPDSVGDIMSLSILQLTNTFISQLPDSCCSLPYLQSLSVGKCPLHSLPASIKGLTSIVELHLDGSRILELPDEIGSLKVIQTLDMGSCTSLKRLPESIGNLSSLSKLNLVHTSIEKLPESIGMLENLITLRLNKCTNLSTLPSSFGQLKSLYHLWMEETSITKLPKNIGMLSKLVILKMKKKVSPEKQIELPVSFGNLHKLQEFDARRWNITGRIPENFKMLSSMETLDLGYNSFQSLTSSLEGLSVLKKLQLPHCQNLELLPPLPSSLIQLNAPNCTVLCSIPDFSNLTNLVELQFSNCGKLQDVPGIEFLRSLRQVYMAGCNASASAVRKRLSKATYEKLSYLGIPGSRIPDGFSKGAVIYKSRVNSALKSVIIGVVLSVKTDIMDELASSPLAAIQVKIIRPGHPNPIFNTTPRLNAMPSTCEDQLYLCRFKDFHPLVSLLEDGDKLEVSMLWIYASSVELRRCGIYLVYENDDEYDGNEDSLLPYSQQSVSQKLATFFQAN